jgi:hypothetical protein
MSMMTFATQAAGASVGFDFNDSWAWIFFADFNVLPDFTTIQVRANFKARAAAGMTNTSVSLHRNSTDFDLYGGKEVTGGSEGTIMDTVSVTADDNWAQYTATIATFANPGNLHPIAVSAHTDNTGVGVIEIRDLFISVRGINP